VKGDAFEDHVELHLLHRPSLKSLEEVDFEGSVQEPLIEIVLRATRLCFEQGGDELEQGTLIQLQKGNRKSDESLEIGKELTRVSWSRQVGECVA